jgi:hypothetical protein
MHLLVAVSAHGYGHIGQTAPVVNELRRRVPELRLTLYSAAAREVLERRFEGPFAHLREAADVGMAMRNALDVDVERSARACASFHRDWAREVERETARLRALAPDLVLSNVAYRVLAAAGRLGIPACALCSLNWAAIYAHYCGARPEGARIHGEMLEGYRQALFLRPDPSMPMPELAHTLRIGPIARRGRARRAELDAALGLTGTERLVLVAPGGIPLRLPMEAWPRLAGVRWLLQEDWAVRHPDAHAFETLGMHFTDLLRSCDVLLTKPGYGSFAEAACNGTAVLYTRRPDWPEAPHLEAWLHAHARAREVAREPLLRGDLQQDLEALLAAPHPEPLEPTGIAEAADALLGLLARAR